MRNGGLEGEPSLRPGGESSLFGVGVAPWFSRWSHVPLSHVMDSVAFALERFQTQVPGWVGLNKCDFTHMTLPCFGPSPLIFKNVKNHEKRDAERGAREIGRRKERNTVCRLWGCPCKVWIVLDGLRLFSKCATSFAVLHSRTWRLPSCQRVDWANKPENYRQCQLGVQGLLD